MPTPLSRPYCTLADVQAECQNTDPSEKDSLHFAINNASRWIDWRCRRDFGYHDHRTVALDVPPTWIGGNELFLPWPVLTLDSVRLFDGSSETTLDPADYRLEPSASATACLVRAGRWRQPDRFASLPPVRTHPLPPCIRLLGTFGYAPVLVGDPPQPDLSQPSPSIPPAIRQACAIIAAIRSGRSRRLVAMPDGTTETVTKHRLPEDILATLDSYRLPLA